MIQPLVPARRASWCIALAISIAACSSNRGEGFESSGSESAIIGGSTASAYPEAALVDLYQNGQLVAACSGSVIAPRVVLTAGHCVDGFTGWRVTAPYASGQKASASSGMTYDWRENGSKYVNPNHHDIGLVFLDSEISLGSYPQLATAPLAGGGQIVNIGRINNGAFSNTDLFVSKPINVVDGSRYGFPLDYEAVDVIQPGDSGGPDELPGSAPHVIVAVNSGAGGGSEVLARVDLLASWINQQIATHGGGGSSGGGGGSSSGGGGSSSGGGGLGLPDAGSGFGGGHGGRDAGRGSPGVDAGPSSPPGSGGSSSGGGAPSGGGGGADVFQSHNLDVLNQYRASKGVAPLVFDTTLSAFALDGSTELAQDHIPHKHFIDAANDGSLWSDGFAGGAAENQGEGWPQVSLDPTQNEMLQIDGFLKAMIDEGPGGGHYDTIMDGSYTKVGIGLLEVNGRLYLTNDFSVQ